MSLSGHIKWGMIRPNDREPQKSVFVSLFGLDFMLVKTNFSYQIELSVMSSPDKLPLPLMVSIGPFLVFWYQWKVDRLHGLCTSSYKVEAGLLKKWKKKTIIGPLAMIFLLLTEFEQGLLSIYACFGNCNYYLVMKICKYLMIMHFKGKFSVVFCLDF